MNETFIKEAKLLNNLWVEGPDDAQLLYHLLKHYHIEKIPPGDVLWPMAGDIVQKVIAAKCNFALVHQIKAEIHTWLAWQEEPGRPMGQAITKRYFDANAPHAQKLIGWVRQFFNLI